jgi:hypothetical protein
MISSPQISLLMRTPAPLMISVMGVGADQRRVLRKED